MADGDTMQMFDSSQLEEIQEAASMAEDLVYNYYKLPSGQRNHPRYDVVTRCSLNMDEIIIGPLAQVIRYEGKPRNSSLGSLTYDFYKICLHDYTILTELVRFPHLSLFPVILYLVTHELIHVVRFSKFLQNFNAAKDDRLIEEKRVHEITRKILYPVNVVGLSSVLAHSEKWLNSLDNLLDGKESES